MRGASFSGSLVFAALAGLVVIPWIMAFAGLVGTGWALGLYSLSLSGVYLMWIAPSWPRGLVAFVVAALFSLAIAVLAAAAPIPMPAAGVCGAALILAVGRSGFLLTGSPARALVIESLLLVGGLLFARVFGSSLLGLGLAFWGFFLIQSLFFLVGGPSERREEGPELDPFESARRQALTLMEGGA